MWDGYVTTIHSPGRKEWMPIFFPADLSIEMTPLSLPNLFNDPDTANLPTLRPMVVILLVLMLLITAFPSMTMAGGRIVSVQSASYSLFEEAIDGFANVCTLPMDRFMVSDDHSIPVEKRIRRVEPELILAVGLDALSALEDIQDIPIVFVMLPCLECCGLPPRANVTGVNMMPPIDVQLCRIHEMLPDVQNVGIVFNPEKTGSLVEIASTAAAPLGIDIIRAPVASAREVPIMLAGIRDQAQMIWMLPDLSVMTRQTVEFFLEFSVENRIPLIAFSEMYVEIGAFMAFGNDPKDMGHQAGEMANMILSGEQPCNVPVQDARKISISVNRALAEKFGILIDENQLKTVKLVE